MLASFLCGTIILALTLENLSLEFPKRSQPSQPAQLQRLPGKLKFS